MPIGKNSLFLHPLLAALTTAAVNSGTSMMGKDGVPMSDEGTGSYMGGTGKFKGLKGKGTYKGKAAADGFEDQIEGDYTLPAGK